MESKGFYSDNCAPVHPRVMEKMQLANNGYVPSYGDDEYSHIVKEKILSMLGGEDAHFVQSGTGANLTSMAVLCQPYQAVICGDKSHIHTSEAGATERASGGKILTVPAAGNKLTPDKAAAYLPYIGNYSKSQPAAISITQSTELGLVYTVDEVRELADFAHANGMYLHMDGARFGNAVAALGCSPKDLTKNAGVDVLSFGMTKNGAMFGEAVVLFKEFPQFRSISKACGQIVSKTRFIAAQFDAMLDGGLWLECAASANAAAAYLAKGLESIDGVRIEHPVQANAVFASFPKGALPALHKNVSCMDWDVNSGTVRFMCSYDLDLADVDAAIAAARIAVSDSYNVTYGENCCSYQESVCRPGINGSPYNTIKEWE